MKKKNDKTEFFLSEEMTHNSYNMIKDILDPVEAFLKKIDYSVTSLNTMLMFPDNYEIVEKVKPKNLIIN